MNFEGTYVAMVTPFTKDEEIDEEGFRSNINFLIDNGVNGLLAAGTTGESATLSHDEHKKVIEILIDEVDGRVETLAGAGSNSTKEAIDLVKFSEDAGADAALVITPYYNKPQQHGLIDHYQVISDASDIPIIAYNVPSRTGVNLDVDTIVELAKIDNVDAIKEASGSIDKISEIYKALSLEGLEEDFNILSGEDGLTLPIMALGGTGVISASANVDPRRMVLMVDSMLNEDYQRAQELHYEMINLIKALFVESNPVPAKTAMRIMGLPSGPLRQPLAEMKEDNVEILKKALKDSNLI
ncbi:4-hydroxy-tetrahydrodipicolinate synthase [Methanobrevibacter woesei]|uniref:4-hydroxy-tetrahydrodipicolinate synthase n=1 Tax=Methanobrevibacter woesei TaxID=190976 RepID=A0A2U1S8R1_9EURY|nr:4-hydroxy-tetrahydrodipicolinate synthase [Methanobrevibacter woesei]MCC9261488.1 4-hydroxy-tetrahydrodipicolinate synthase [Methanobrevibacter woesei]MCI7292144.1 4-hydroxy-tetrahydrodipicolinate synthase [Methanobrevibacter woesei]PWB86614.1 4-hydroxy-tetrahydrodipicolinate synthase [Methanobrevibacter woesei]